MYFLLKRIKADEINLSDRYVFFSNSICINIIGNFHKNNLTVKIPIM